MFILRDKVYDAVKFGGKWALPAALLILPLIDDFVANQDFGVGAFISFIVAALTIILNAMQSVSSENYYAQEEEE